MPVPTVDDIPNQTAVSSGFHNFAVEDGTIRVSTDLLRTVLTEYYDPCITNWVALIDETDFQA